MSLVSLRTLTDDAAASTFDFSGSRADRIFAEDYNRIKAAIQSGTVGIRTFSLQVGDSTTPTTQGQARFGNSVAIGTGLTAASTALTVTGAGSLSGALTVGGNIAVGGTVDAVDVAAHTHDGTASGAPKIPLSSVSGASGAWSAHSHSGDGSAQVPSAGIEDGAVTFVKVAGAAIGLTASTVASGLTLNDTRQALKLLLEPGANDLPMLGQFISAGQMFVISGDSEATISLHSASPGCNIYGRRFLAAGNIARMTVVVPANVSNVRLFGIYVLEGVVDPSPVAMSPGNFEVQVDHFSIGQYMSQGESLAAIWSPDISDNGVLTTSQITSWVPLNSPSDAEAATISISVSDPDCEMFLLGCALVYDINYGAW